MATYYVNKQVDSDGAHEVHTGSCYLLRTTRHFLGEFSTCREAVIAARKLYTPVNGCRTCSNPCHSG